MTKYRMKDEKGETKKINNILYIVCYLLNKNINGTPSESNKIEIVYSCLFS